MFWWFLGLAALVAASHLRLEQRFDSIEQRIRRVESELLATLAQFEARIEPGT